MRRLAAILPEVALIICAATLTASLHLVLGLDAEARVLSTLAVATCLGSFVLAVLGFTLRPWLLWSRSARDTGDWTAWGLPLVMMSVIAPLLTAMTVLIPALVTDTAFGPALLLLVVGGGWAIAGAVQVVVLRQRTGAARRLLGPARVWHGAVGVLMATVVFTWWLSDWNPALHHYRVRARVVAVHGVEGVAAGDPCLLDLGWFEDFLGRHRCRARFFCNGTKLYGVLGEAAFECEVRDLPTFSIKGEDADAHDGDPAFSIDTAAHQIRFSEQDLWVGEASLSAEILLEEPGTE